ncbi:MAG: hypothetical protein RSF67_08360 [Clostridia bacterium]
MLEQLEIEYFNIFREWPLVFNWDEIDDNNKITILNKCIEDKVQVYKCNLHTNEYLEQIID